MYRTYSLFKLKLKLLQIRVDISTEMRIKVTVSTQIITIQLHNGRGKFCLFGVILMPTVTKCIKFHPTLIWI
jgi:hypothetical protein